MKINRLLEMTIILLNKGTITAKELAERFGVSTRTIFRDIDVLSAAGVPVFANRGANGGIALLENYALNKVLISDKESESILFALKTLQMTKYPEVDRIVDKLGALFHTTATDWINIDFSPWSSNPNEHDKFQLIKTAVLQCRIIDFDYINAENKKSHRKIEPLRLIFKGQAWYLWGWCRQREDYRTFRISRIKDVTLTDVNFDRSRTRPQKEKKHAGGETQKPLVMLKLKFTKEVLYRLYDDYDDSMIIKNSDGTYDLSITFPEDEWVYGYILSFGAYAEVLEPEHIRTIIRERSEKIFEKYK